MIFQVCTSNSFLPVMIPRFLVNLNELAFIFSSLSNPLSSLCALSEIICPLSLKKSVILIASKAFSTTSGWESTTTNSIGLGESIRRRTNNIPCEPAMLSQPKSSGDPPETSRGGFLDVLTKSVANPDKILKNKCFFFENFVWICQWFRQNIRRPPDTARGGLLGVSWQFSSGQHCWFTRY